MFEEAANSPCQTDIRCVVEKLLTQKEVALRLGISERTLERHRVIGTGPRFVRLGRLVRYRLSDLIDWVASSVRRSTSDLPLTTHVKPLAQKNEGAPAHKPQGPRLKAESTCDGDRAANSYDD